MGKQLYHFIVNLGLLISGILTVFSGLLIQVEYHMGHHGEIAINDHVMGINYFGWTGIHKISITLLSLLMILHISRHWKWYKGVIKKKLAGKNIQVLTLSVVFVLVAITGFLPWLIDVIDGPVTWRKGLIEIHDKLTIILAVYLMLHVAKRLKWFFTAFVKMKNRPGTSHQ